MKCDFYRRWYWIIGFILFGTALKAQKTDSLKIKVFNLNFSYLGDHAVNFSGGIKTGYRYLGMANITTGFDAERAGLIKGFSAYLNIANTHGAMPSLSMLGDMQVASNIEAGNHTYMQEFWIKQVFRNFEFTLGLQDLNVEFASSEYGSLFLNSSFGVLPTLSANIAAPIFPLTNIGFTAKWNITENTSYLLAIYDGRPDDFDHNRFNLKWRYRSGDGLLYITEFQYSYKLNQLPGTYKLGLFSHNHLNEKHYPDSLHFSIFGAYLYGDQTLWQGSGRSLGLFFQLGYSPSDNSTCNHYLGGGLHFTGLFTKSKNDLTGLAIACENFNGNAGNETFIELTWQKTFLNQLYIQPDFQYIIHPSGRNSGLANCFIGIIRFGLML